MVDQYEKVLNILLRDTKIKDLHGNNTYAALVDFSLPANEHRLFIVDLKQEKIVWTGYTSHGQGSGSVFKATEFSNEPDSHKSVLGILRTAETYQSSKVGFALKLDGLVPGLNDNVRARGIVIHSADYVSDFFVTKMGYPGRSWGCITVNPLEFRKVIDMLKGGSVVHITNR